MRTRIFLNSSGKLPVLVNLAQPLTPSLSPSEGERVADRPGEGKSRARHYLRGLLLVIYIAGIGVFFAGCSKSESTTEAKTLYSCGMHPQVIQDHPGNCPICGMKLTPVRKQAGVSSNTGTTGAGAVKYYKSTMIPGEISHQPGKDSMGMEMVAVYEDEAAMDATISIDPITIQNMALRTVEIARGPLQRTIRTVGIVEHTESGMADVTTKFKGWVENLYVDATGQHVHRGDPLFEIYSPELYSAQTEYLLALQSSSGTSGEALRESARNKLKFWDISEAQIAELEQTKIPSKTLRIGAPIDGYVMEKMVVAGQMVEAGMRLYRLANHDTVWVQAQIYENDLAYLRLGQDAEVTIAAWPDIRFRGRVTFIASTMDEKTRSIMVRMEFHNPGHLLRPGMYATAQIAAPVSPSVVLVPDMAVLRSGAKNTVFVALDGGKFEPRTVVLGRVADGDYYEVISGLSAGERVVSSGQFLLDSESQLREAIQKMLKPGTIHASHDIPSPHQSATLSPSDGERAGARGATNNPSTAQKLIYICPMPEHVAIEHSQPGKCSLCDMTLVPVSPELLAKIQPGGKLEGYTCPMPEHSDVRQEGPGKCPKCAMTLVPIMSLPKVEEPLAAPKLFTCPMASHAHIVTDKPGLCPDCEMVLVPTSTVKHKQAAEDNWRKQHQH